MSGLPPIEKIACGSWHSLAIDKNGDTWGWGKNHFGMLGTGDSLSSEIPVKIAELKNICHVGGGCFQSIAIDKQGEIWTMGDNPSGQLGQGNYNRLYSPSKINLSNAKVFNGETPTVHSGKTSFWKIVKYLVA